MAQGSAPARPDLPIWTACDTLGLLDRYESLIASVCYEYIEAHVMETCTKKWDESMLTVLREWMAEKVVPWMVMPYARGARNRQCHRIYIAECDMANFLDSGRSTFDAARGRLAI